jgi:hypothetical protein
LFIKKRRLRPASPLETGSLCSPAELLAACLPMQARQYGQRTQELQNR